MKPKIWLIVFLILVAGLFGIWKAKWFLEIDSCLDHGGRWNYKGSYCETTDEVESTLPIETIETTSDTLEPEALDEIDLKSDLKKYIGTYSKQTDIFKNPIVVNELTRILGSDYKAYQEHVSFSGSGEVSYKYGLIYGDVSQLHVGGYGSLFFINAKSQKMYLFWLKESVRDKKYKIYGDRPVPANVLNIISQEMNIGWGHVAAFNIVADSIEIELK